MLFEADLCQCWVIVRLAIRLVCHTGHVALFKNIFRFSDLHLNIGFALGSIDTGRLGNHLRGGDPFELSGIGLCQVDFLLHVVQWVEVRFGLYGGGRVGFPSIEFLAGLAAPLLLNTGRYWHIFKIFIITP